jgi:hypothetical protein
MNEPIEANIIAVKQDEPHAAVPMVVQPTMIRPIVSVDEAVDAWKEYQSLKVKLADKGDFANIQGKMHPTKQFSNKLSRLFGLSVQIMDRVKETLDDSFTWHIIVRATAPNGQFRESDGHCSSKERKFSHVEHDVYATAVTRAKNRAIMEFVGFGEVSAEEILDGDTNGEHHAQAVNTKPVAAVIAKVAENMGKELSPKGKEIRKDLGDMLLKMAHGNTDGAKFLLEKYSAFTPKDGSEERKATTLANMSEGWIKTTYGRVKKAFEDGEALRPDESSDAAEEYVEVPFDDEAGR